MSLKELVRGSENYRT